MKPSSCAQMRLRQALALACARQVLCEGDQAVLDREVLDAMLSGSSASQEDLDAIRNANLQRLHSVVPTDCETSPWSGWTPCTKSCGIGLKARARMVLAQPTHGGLACPTLMENVECNIAACEALAVIPPTAFASPAFSIVEVHGGIQLGAYPYIYGGGQANRQQSVEACQQQCLSDPTCAFGTFVTRTAVLPSQTHAWGSVTREGECWLSAHTHVTEHHCGVPCTGFRKERSAAATTQAPAVTAAPAAPPAVTACACSPEVHASAFTVCHLDPFNHHIRVVHLAARFHTQVYQQGVQHRCKIVASAACRCCDCNPEKRFKDIKSVGFGVHTATEPFLENGANNVTQYECEEQCHSIKQCLVGTWISSHGSKKGACWLSSNVERASSCNQLCYSFEKVDVPRASHDANNLPAAAHKHCAEGERYICFAPTRCSCFPQLIGR